jgi:hypothetical protein
VAAGGYRKLSNLITEKYFFWLVHSATPSVLISHAQEYAQLKSHFISPNCRDEKGKW